MPARSVIWVKLMFNDLLSDPQQRFVNKLNDEQKGLFLMLILLMGFYKNAIPNDPKTLKRVLNLKADEETIKHNIQTICDTFPRGIKNSQVIKFKNYNKFHNYVWYSKKTDIMSRERLDRFINAFKKGYFKATGTYYNVLFARDYAIAKDILKKLGDSKALLACEVFFNTKGWWSDKLTLGVFKSVIPQLLTKLTSPKPQLPPRGERNEETMKAYREKLAEWEKENARSSETYKIY